MRILILDDHPLFRKGVKILLEEQIEDSKVFEAETVFEATQIIVKEDIEFVTLDINLGEDSGIDYLKLIKESYPHIKIIMLTMYDLEEIFQEAIDYGADGYLLKDSSAEEIVLALKSCAKGVRYISGQLTENLITKNEFSNQLNLLTQTERKVLKFVAKFMSSREIAEVMHVHYRTIENHRTNISRKLDLTGKKSLIKFAVTNKDFL